VEVSAVAAELVELDEASRSEVDALVALQSEDSDEVAFDAVAVVVVAAELFVLEVAVLAVTVAGAWLAMRPPSPTSAATLAPPATLRARSAAWRRRRFRGVAALMASSSVDGWSHRAPAT
jgi:hypothetical protein